MNFVPAKAQGDTVVIDTDESLGQFPVSLAPGQKVIAGFRPEDIQLSETGIAAKVALIEPTGAETQLVLRTGKTSIIMTTRERIDLSPGDQVHFSLAPGKLHCFDADTELAIPVSAR